MNILTIFLLVSTFLEWKTIAFCPLDTSCEKDTGITVFIVVCGFPMYREGVVPLHLFYHPHVTKLGNVVAKAMAS